jgi:flavin-binding protein dodecin
LTIEIAECELPRWFIWSLVETAKGDSFERPTRLVVPSQLYCAHSMIAWGRENAMSDSVYKVIEIIGTSSKSWEDAAATAVERASQSLRDLRVAEVTEQDVQIKDGKIELYRTKLKLSFKFEEST